MISFQEERTKRQRQKDDRRRREEREESKQLYELVNSIVSQQSDQTDISPTWIATQCLVRLRGNSVQKKWPLIYKAAHLQLRQIGRAVCRSQFEPDDDAPEAAQHDLFPGLQVRYPIAKQPGDEPVYRRLENMTHDDRVYNIKRLRSEAIRKTQHADALEAHDQMIMREKSA
jgi:hypothetical protein